MLQSSVIGKVLWTPSNDCLLSDSLLLAQVLVIKWRRPVGRQIENQSKTKGLSEMSRIILCSAVIVALIGILVCSANADVVMDWNDLASVTSNADSEGHRESRDAWSPKDEAEEIVAVAIFQAVNAVNPRYKPFRAPLAPVPPDASAPAAAAAAGHAALVQIFPDRKAALDDAFQLALAQMPDTSARAAGVEVGERAAAQVIAARAVDHAGTPTPYRPAAPPGVWVPTTSTTIPAYYWSAKPWLLSSISQFRPKAPVSLASQTWARDYNETRTLGARNSTARSAEWTRLAIFYSQWRQWPLVRQIAAAPGRTLEQNARLYALVAMAVADADSAMVDGKLTYMFWRPITAIRNGDQDGNVATERQANWEPLLKTPMHPEYPCGHCVIIAALTAVLGAEGPPPAGGIAVTSDVLPGAVRYVASYATLTEEISLSRIYAGAHFRSSIEAGAALGHRVAEYAIQGFLKPLH
jgi:PAP2 superfamily